MDRLVDFFCETFITYAPYIGIAIMIGVNKAVYQIENNNLPFTIGNILKYSIVYSIIAPLKIGFDIKTQIHQHGEKVERMKKESTKETLTNQK